MLSAIVIMVTSKLLFGIVTEHSMLLCNNYLPHMYQLNLHFNYVGWANKNLLCGTD